MFQVDRRIFAHFDYIIPLLIIPIILLSFYLVNEMYATLANKQIVYFITGAIIFTFFFLFPIRKFIWLIPLIYWLNIILLLSVEFFGVTKLGAQRWIEIPFINFTIQPSELMKPALILMLAYLIKTSPPESERGYNWKEFFKLSIYILIPFILILKEPDLGTAMILLFVGFGVLFVIGVHYRIWITIFGIIALITPFIYGNLHDYQKKRISDFLAEKPSYHVHQSIIAIGSGGIQGKSKEEATQTHLKFLPISTSDFIFSFHIERFGFIGGAVLIIIYALLILHLLLIVLYSKGDYFIQVFASAVAFLFFFYMAVNIAMTIGYAPVVGLPLPLFSYGGSSFMTFIILIGILEHLLSFRYQKNSELS